MILRDGYLHGHYLGEFLCGTCAAPVIVARAARTQMRDGFRYQNVMIDRQPGSGPGYDHRVTVNSWTLHPAGRGDRAYREHICASTAKVLDQLRPARKNQARHQGQHPKTIRKIERLRDAVTRREHADAALQGTYGRIAGGLRAHLERGQ